MVAGCVLIGVVSVKSEFLEQIQEVPPTPAEFSSLNDRSGKLFQLPLKFTPFDSQRAQIPFRRELLADRRTYLADDPVGQVLGYCFAPLSASQKPLELKLELKLGAKVIDTQKIAVNRKFSALIPLQNLSPGDYEICGSFLSEGRTWNLRPALFTVSSERRNAQPIPKEGIPLVLQSSPMGGLQVSPIITGIPISRHQARSLEEFTLLEDGKPVPAQFSERATWYPGQEIKWLGLSFLARYTNGKPAEYRLVHKNSSAASSPLKVTESETVIRVDTGAIEFEVGRKPFTGIQLVKLAGRETGVVSGKGGPFLIDERGKLYNSELDETARVVIEESGPVRVTILAEGWLTNPQNERLCRYETRFTAWAGQPWIDVSQRTIFTFNTDEKKLSSLGFLVQLSPMDEWAAGVDGVAIRGEIVAPPEMKKKSLSRRITPPLSPPATTGWLIQTRADQVAIEASTGKVAEGKRADGWVRLASPSNGSILLQVRHLWQLFPKEIAWSPDALVVYQWPEHGRISFTEDEELDKKHLHQIRYAHQGKYLDLKFPQKYFEAIRSQFPPIIENQDINALSGNGMGLAATTDFRLQFAPQIQDQMAGESNLLYAANLHGISDPVWNGLTEVEGRFAGKQKGITDEWDQFFAQAFNGFKSSVDILGNYGMWIWPDVHNNWSPATLLPQAHRWWLNSHYQNVWDYNFMYFRSANPRNKDWANAATRHFMDIGTVNYADSDRSLLGKLPGANYHVKGFTPWGSAREGEIVGDDYVEVGAHFINPDAALFRYLLFGDTAGLNLAKKWFESLGSVTLPAERSREACTTLGELLSFYENTWNPQAIAYIHEMADAMLSRPFSEVPAFPAHPFFHDRWVMRYWNLVGDPRIQEPVIDVVKQSGKLNFPHWELAALAWRWTGDVNYLKMLQAKSAPPYGRIYQNPEDPLDGFGVRVFYPTHSLTQIMPYYLQSLFDAGLKYPQKTPNPPSIPKPMVLNKNGKKVLLKTSTSLLKADGVSPLTLHVQGMVLPGTWEKRVLIGNLNIFDAKNKLAGSTSVLAGSLRPEAKIEIDPAKHPLPWTLTVFGAVAISWSGNSSSAVLEPIAGGMSAKDEDSEE